MALVEPLCHWIVATHIQADLLDADGFRVQVLVVARAVEISAVSSPNS